jgi:hypothetical protein
MTSEVVNNAEAEENFVIAKNLGEYKPANASVQPAPQASNTSSPELFPVQDPFNTKHKSKNISKSVPEKHFENVQNLQEYNDVKECIVVNVPKSKSIDFDIKYDPAVDINPNKVVAATTLLAATTLSCNVNSVNEFIATLVQTKHFPVCVPPGKNSDNIQSSSSSTFGYKYFKFSTASAYAKLNVAKFRLDFQYMMKNYITNYNCVEYCDDTIIIIHGQLRPPVTNTVNK